MTLMIQAVMAMNKRQLIVQKQFVQDEKAVIRELKHEYSKALAEINDRIKVLQASEMTQSVGISIGIKTAGFKNS